MKIPPEIKIGGCNIRVIKKPLNEIDSECNGGWARWEQNEIWIAFDIPEDRQAEIFLHEVLHFVNIYMSEKEVTFLAASLYQAMKDNALQFI